MERESNQLHADVTGQRPVGKQTYVANDANNWWEHNPHCTPKQQQAFQGHSKWRQFRKSAGGILDSGTKWKDRNNATEERPSNVSNYMDIAPLHSRWSTHWIYIARRFILPTHIRKKKTLHLITINESSNCFGITPGQDIIRLASLFKLSS
jgi:hypothetical protein